MSYNPNDVNNGLSDEELVSSVEKYLSAGYTLSAACYEVGVGTKAYKDAKWRLDEKKKKKEDEQKEEKKKEEECNKNQARMNEDTRRRYAEEREEEEREQEEYEDSFGLSI